MKVSTSLKIFSLLGAASTALCVLFSFLDWHEVAVWICIVTQGISISGIFLYNLSLPSEFNLQLTDKQVSTIMIAMMLSEAIMVAPTGYLMENIYLKVFFIALFLFNFILAVNSRYCVWLMGKYSQDKSENVEGNKEERQ